MKEEIQELIKKYKKGVEIHEKQMNNPKLAPTIQNRNSYQMNLCLSFVDDLEDLIKNK